MPTTLTQPSSRTVPVDDDAWREIVAAVTRRQLLVGGAAFMVLGACSRDSASRSSTEGSEDGWVFTDDRGVEIGLQRRPERIVAYVGTAAALWDFGVRPLGVFGPQRRKDGTPEPAAGRLDLDAVESVGEVWDGVNLEALAALQPDLVVSGGTEAPWVISEQLDVVGEIAPVAIVEVYGAPARTIISNYQRLAVALGADLDSEAMEQTRADFDRAADELAAAATAKSGLRVLATYANNEGLYVAKPADFPDLLEFRELGVDVVEPDGPDDYWAQLSWEQADRYPADVIIHDIRSYSLQPDALAEFPTWAALPAVRAGQVGAWSAETVLSYQGFTTAFRDLADLIQSADADIA
jgi:iron complex transport system substrate-binding protein